jgi:8-hydroxy-5-deazaflavin:NADPH oxidoreductase
MMKVAILGTGQVGIALAKGFVATGHEVIFGSRDPKGENALRALAAVPDARSASYAQAAKECDLALLATSWDGAMNALQLAGASALSGKTVIDVTNPLDTSGGAPKLAIGHTDSAGEAVQRALPDTHVVKAFNIINCGLFFKPQFSDGQPDMFIAGNNAAAKAQVSEIVRSFGWRSAIDMGGIEKARLLEPLAMLWIDYGVSRNHWTHGFSLLRQQS